MKGETALRDATDAGPTERGGDSLELCLTHEVAAREKLVAVLAQFLGVPSLDKYKSGIRFFPRERRVRNELQQRAQTGSSEAGALLQALIAFDELPAIGLRNQLAHGVMFLPTVTEICYFRIETLGLITASPGGSKMQYLLPEGMLDQGDLLPETLFAWVERDAREALEAFDELIALTTRLVERVGELAPVTAVYRVPGRAGYLLELPSPDEAI